MKVFGKSQSEPHVIHTRYIDTMATPQEAEDAGHARYAYRVRVSSTALAALLGEWDRCRWIWNECVARSKKAHADGEKCGPARLDKMLTQAQPLPLPATGRVIGVDWGVKETATTTSDTHDLPHAEHGKKSAGKLTGYQRMMARRKPQRGQAASKGTARRSGRPRRSTRRSPGNGKTAPASGPSTS